MNPIVLFGAGKIGHVLLEHLRNHGDYEVSAFTCEEHLIPDDASFQGLPIVAFETIENRYSPERFDMIIALGYQELNAVRSRFCRAAKDKGYRLASFVSRSATQGDWVNLGENCVVLDNVSIEPATRIGNNVVLWSGVLVGHHSVIEDDCWLAGQAVLGGSARLGSGTFVGLNATIANEVQIGERSFVGANAFVTKCAGPKSVFVSADTAKFRLDSDRFLRISKIR